MWIIVGAALAGDPWCAGERRIEDREWPAAEVVPIPAWEVVPQQTRVPGHDATFSAVYGPAFDGDTVVFGGEWGPPNDRRTGIFRWRAGVVETVVEQGAPIPGRTEAFRGFGRVDAEDGRIVFRASGTEGSDGVYVLDGDGLRAIATAGARVPGRDKTWRTFVETRLVDGHVVFLAQHVEQEPPPNAPEQRVELPPRAADEPPEVVWFPPDPVIGVGVYVWDGRRVTTVARTGAAPARGAPALAHLRLETDRVPGRLVFTGGPDARHATTWLVDGCALVPAPSND